jgi:hypothetical protein
MYKVMIFLHIVGAVGMGIYAILPFLIGKFKHLSGAAQEGLASGLVAAGRVGQYSLVLQLLTGGYLISNTDAKDFAVSWMITIVLLFVVLGALSGIVQAPLKRIVADSTNARNASGSISRAQMLSTIIFIVFLVEIWLMKNPWLS